MTHARPFRPLFCHSVQLQYLRQVRAKHEARVSLLLGHRTRNFRAQPSAAHPLHSTSMSSDVFGSSPLDAATIMSASIDGLSAQVNGQQATGMGRYLDLVHRSS